MGFILTTYNGVLLQAIACSAGIFSPILFYSEFECPKAVVIRWK